VERHEATGNVSPRPRGGKSRSPLEPQRDWRLKLVAQEPDLTLRQLERRIRAGVGLVTTERSVRRFFTRHRISLRKTLLRKAAERTRGALGDKIGDALPAFTPPECANYFKHAGYAPI
jgi:transposase